MYKLFKGELKKIFSGFEIFVMIIALSVVFTILPHFFKPIDQFDYINSCQISKTSVTSIKHSFDSLSNESALNLNALKNDLNYMIDLTVSPSKVLREKQNELNNKRILFSQKIEAEDEDGCESLENDMRSILQELKLIYSGLFEDHFVPMILVNKTLDYKIKMERVSFENALEGTRSDMKYFRGLNDTLREQKFTEHLAIYFSEIKDLPYSKENLKTILNTYLNGYKDDYKEDLKIKITNLYDLGLGNVEENISSKNRENMFSYVNHFLQTNEHIRKVVLSSSRLEFSSSLTDNEFSKFIKFDSFNSFKERETKTRDEYLLDNDMLDSDVSSVFAFNAKSSVTTNAMDYMFFTLEIVGVLIIVFTAIIGAEMVTKEESSGTIKLLLMRPYSRGKIMLSKILATLFMGDFLILIGVIVSLITGAALYGISISPMLLIFNASAVALLPNWVVLLIYILCLMIKIWFYVMLTIMISTLFKSLVASICVSGGICIANIIATFLLGDSILLKYDLFANLDLFKYLGGGFITEGTLPGRNIGNLFAYHLFEGTTILVPAIILVVSIVIFNIVTFFTFKNRDIT